MDQDPIEIEDICILVSLLTLFFLMVWIIVLLRRVDESKFDKVCSGGPTVSLTKGQLSNLLGGYEASAMKTLFLGDNVPSIDLNITSKLKCDNE